jgi:hypothetical protein
VGADRSLDIDADRPVVTMHRLTQVVSKGDEVAGTKDVHGLSELDMVAFMHGGDHGRKGRKRRSSRSRI